MTSSARGNAGEMFAENYLLARGLILVERNFNASCGEIDRIFWQSQQLIFVEVRLRRASAFATAAETVTAAKREKIRRTAAVYLQKHPYNCACRFDVVAVLPTATGFHADWIQNAFD